VVAALVVAGPVLAGLTLVGIAKLADILVIQRTPGSRNHQPTVLLLKLIPGPASDPQIRAIGFNLNLTWRQTQPITKLLRDNQTPCRIDGCLHAISLPIN
jgi:hypothetical protein